MLGDNFWHTFDSNGHNHTRKGSYQPEDVVLMQYTGLEDKNGTPVYEGDIIKAYHWSLDENFEAVKDESSYDIRQVIWSDEHASYLVLGEINNLPSDYLGNCSQIEVIGNKFENPELLEQ